VKNISLLLTRQNHKQRSEGLKRTNREEEEEVEIEKDQRSTVRRSRSLLVKVCEYIYIYHNNREIQSHSNKMTIRIVNGEIVRDSSPARSGSVGRLNNSNNTDNPNSQYYTSSGYSSATQQEAPLPPSK